MALPTALQNALAKLKQGPVDLIIDPDGDNVQLFLKDGIDITFQQGIEVAEADVVGVWDLYTQGDSCEFSIRVPEWTTDVLAVLFREGTSGSGYRGFGRTAGYSKRTDAKKFQIRPWQTKDVSTDQIHLWKVVSNGDISVSMKKTEPYTWEIPFKALPDATKADGEMIGAIYAAAR